MATRANRAATGASKQGGKSKTRNRTSQSYSSEKPLDSRRNQRVFREGRKETQARNRNRTAGVPTRKKAYGVLTQQLYTPIDAPIRNKAGEPVTQTSIVPDWSKRGPTRPTRKKAKARTTRGAKGAGYPRGDKKKNQRSRVHQGQRKTKISAS